MIVTFQETGYNFKESLTVKNDHFDRKILGLDPQKTLFVLLLESPLVKLYFLVIFVRIFNCILQVIFFDIALHLLF